jgi:hypothetical protein
MRFCFLHRGVSRRQLLQNSVIYQEHRVSAEERASMRECHGDAHALRAIVMHEQNQSSLSDAALFVGAGPGDKQCGVICSCPVKHVDLGVMRRLMESGAYE